LQKYQDSVLKVNIPVLNLCPRGPSVSRFPCYLLTNQPPLFPEKDNTAFYANHSLKSIFLSPDYFPTLSDNLLEKLFNHRSCDLSSVAANILNKFTPHKGLLEQVISVCFYLLFLIRLLVYLSQASE